MNTAPATTTTFTAGPESVAAMRFVNEAVAAGKTVTVNGVEVWRQWSSFDPATSWANGSFSWTSKARTTNNGKTNWVKRGGTVRVEVA